MGYIKQIIDEETGEIMATEKIKKSEIKIDKQMINKMLSNAKGEADIDVKMLYTYCRKTGVVNDYGQIQTYGNKLNDRVENVLLEQATICVYVMRALKLGHTFTHLLKSNQKTFISNWSELWENIGCKKSKTRKEVKEFLLNYGLIDKFRINRGNNEMVSRLIVNPFLYKNSSHTGQIACVVWQDYARKGENINKYAYDLLVGMGYINHKNRP